MYKDLIEEGLTIIDHFQPGDEVQSDLAEIILEQLQVKRNQDLDGRVTAK